MTQPCLVPLSRKSSDSRQSAAKTRLLFQQPYGSSFPKLVSISYWSFQRGQDCFRGLSMSPYDPLFEGFDLISLASPPRSQIEIGLRSRQAIAMPLPSMPEAEPVWTEKMKVSVVCLPAMVRRLILKDVSAFEDCGGQSGNPL